MPLPSTACRVLTPVVVLTTSGIQQPRAGLHMLIPSRHVPPRSPDTHNPPDARIDGPHNFCRAPSLVFPRLTLPVQHLSVEIARLDLRAKGASDRNEEEGGEGCRLKRTAQLRHSRQLASLPDKPCTLAPRLYAGKTYSTQRQVVCSLICGCSSKRFVFFLACGKPANGPERDRSDGSRRLDSFAYSRQGGRRNSYTQEGAPTSLW